jgi:pimeloyl-ACP methyl ester carboxylesterase
MGFMKLTVGVLLLTGALLTAQTQNPKPIGKLVQLDGHRLHVNCSGKGQPTVVVENGFDEFSFDWIMVQSGVEKFTRICTYDRPGYAWSDPGPLPRTYAQINLDLRSALTKMGEKPPYLFVGHSFGGPVIRTYALGHPDEVAGLVFAESVGEAHRILMGPKTARIADFAKGRPIPAPHAAMTSSDRVNSTAAVHETPTIEPPFDRLPPDLQEVQLWAWSQGSLQDAENSEREWSPEYLAEWLKKDQQGSLGNLPVVVLAREKGGFGEGHDISAAELEKQRRQEMADLASLSTAGKLSYVDSGHEMELEAPNVIVNAVREMVMDWRRQH